MTGKTEVKTVLSTSVLTKYDVVTVTTADAKTHQILDRLTVTPEHPWHTDTGWVLAGNLAVGTSILTRAGPAVVVQSVEKTHSDAGILVYNFIVQDDHSYFVGNQEEWVHNGSSLCSKNAAALRASLEAAGIHAAPGDAAHHIVPSGDPRGAISRALLAAEGIDGNDSANGVFLPKNNSLCVIPFVSAGMQSHSTIHTNLYFQNVESDLLNASPGQLQSVLSNIASQLQKGLYPH